jgi:hypothetical protein
MYIYTYIYTYICTYTYTYIHISYVSTKDSLYNITILIESNVIIYAFLAGLYIWHIEDSFKFLSCKIIEVNIIIIYIYTCENIYTHICLHTHIRIYIYIYI